jgi:hydroxyethylthiazole kinase-like uncharacterized protein yjeF
MKQVNVSTKGGIIEAANRSECNLFHMIKGCITPVLTAGEMRALDDFSIRNAGVPSLELMANAAKAVLAEIVSRFPSPTTRIGIFCGKGNNGGDGLALAHYLWHARRRNFTVYVLSQDPGKPFSPDAQHYLDLLRADGPDVTIVSDPFSLAGDDFGVKVDALFGTGMDRPLDGFWTACLNTYNSLSGFSLAVDCPSGVNCTTGEIMGAAVKADCTVTFGFPKAGFFKKNANSLLGELAIAEIGLGRCIDAGIQPREFSMNASYCQHYPIGLRRKNVHKGDFGRVLVIAGSHGFSGAAKMCSTSALRAGAGLVRLYVPAEVYVPVASSLTEVMVASFDSRGFPESPAGLNKLRPDLAWADIIALGSGLSLRADLQEAALSVLVNSDKPVVADAEGCFAAKRWLLEYGQRSSRVVILTPHMGEFAKLAEISLETALSEPERNALELSRTLGCYILLKSDNTFLATPSGFILRPPAGSPALAKGGSGDVLVGALAARTAIALRAWKMGVSPYTEYLTSDYYLNYPPELPEKELPVLEGILRGYALYAQASHDAVKLAGTEESVLATEIAELLNAETEWRE